MDISFLWRNPEINPINGKARSIPVLNPLSIHGRVFLFSWVGFFIAFWSWYAFPPLLTITIKSDLHLSQDEVANSNIAALVATLLIRLISGPLCDRYGPRNVFAGLLLAGAIPTVLAGTVKSATGLIVLRFFVGILGVGTSNALIGGWGNAGGGITYFVMPAIFDSLVQQRGVAPHVAWRVAFVVPFILITCTAILMLLLCPDTPTGKWSDRHLCAQRATKASKTHNVSFQSTSHHNDINEPEKGPISGSKSENINIQADEARAIDEYQHEIARSPTIRESIQVAISPQSITLAFGYFNSFGAELAINSILGAYYKKNFPGLGQTGSGRWAAMFGLLNIITRPLGGIIGDVIYRYTNGSLWAKKLWIHVVGVITGVFAIIIGILDPKDLPTMIGLVFGLAIFMEAGNGANFALVPHVHPYANGVLSGIIAAAGNLGGVAFAIVFRYNNLDYHRVFWVIGIASIVMNLCVSWIKPIPKGQIGGR